MDVAILPDVITACHWTFSFQSVIGFGAILEIKDEEGKIQALNHIMKQYSNKNWSYPQKMLSKVRVWKLLIETISGKQSKDKEVI